MSKRRLTYLKHYKNVIAHFTESITHFSRQNDTTSHICIGNYKEMEETYNIYLTRMPPSQNLFCYCKPPSMATLVDCERKHSGFFLRGLQGVPHHTCMIGLLNFNGSN